jgi:hypothetical protein
MVKSTRTKKSRRSRRVMLNPSSYIQPIPTIYKIRLSYEFDLTSSGGGTLYAAEAITAASSGEFSTLGSLYDEYRVMGGLVTIAQTIPLITSSSSQQNRMVFVAFDTVDVSTPVTDPDVYSLGTRAIFRAISLDQKPFRFKFTFPMTGPNTAIDWIPTSTPVSTGSIKFACSALTASTTYFNCLMDLYVEFRARI